MPAHDPQLTADIALGRKLGKLARVYFLVLGLLGIAGCVVNLFFSRGFHLDLSFLIYLLIAAGLREFRNGCRILAILLCAGYLTAGLVLVELALIRGTGGMTLAAWGREYEDPRLWVYLLVLGVALLIFAVPFGVLLHPAVRRVFRAITKFRKLKLERVQWD